MDKPSQTARIRFDGCDIACRPGQSVLEALEQAGHRVPSGCRSGACQACLLHADDSEATTAAQAGLSPAQRLTGLFLSCQCRPAANEQLHVRRPADSPRHVARVLGQTWLGASVYRLRLQCDIDYLPGQYITLFRDDCTARSFSIASLPGPDRQIDLHVRHRRDGAVSDWAARLKPDSQLWLQGPMGRCVYASPADQPLLLLALGTGLGAMTAILHHALSRGHRAPIHLLAATRRAVDAYGLDLRDQLPKGHPVTIRHMALQGQRPGMEQQDLYDAVRAGYPDLAGWAVHLCGSERMVATLRRHAFVAGAAMRDIHADIFHSGTAGREVRNSA